MRKLLAVVLFAALAVACSKKAENSDTSADNEKTKQSEPADADRKATTDSGEPAADSQATPEAAAAEAEGDAANDQEGMTKTAVYVAKFHHDS